MSKKKNPNRGSTLDDFLEDNGMRAQLEAVAVKEVLAWQITREMGQQKITKDAMAKRMKTSRSQLNRLLDPKNEGVSLATLQRAAEVLGKSLRIELS